MNVADKIRKLLSLAQSSNPNEAALAAARAQELMVKYAIDEAQLGGTPGHVEEPITAEPMGSGAKARVQHWHASLANALAPSFFCCSYSVPGSDVYAVGRPLDREALRATWFYLRDEIAKMADTAWAVESRNLGASGYSRQQLGGQAIRFKRGFAVGAVSTVKQRLADAMKQLNAAEPGTAIVLANRQLAVNDAYEKIPGLRQTRYREGQKAGWALSLDKRSAHRALTES